MKRPFIYFLILMMGLGNPCLKGQTNILADSPSETPPAVQTQQKDSWKKAYMRKLTRVSPRVSYGVGFYNSHMNYEVPDLSGEITDAANHLKSRYPWVPWKQVTLPQGDLDREKMLRKNGAFFATAGINLPIVFIDVEASTGRFSQPLITVSDVWPPWETLNKESLGKLLVKRVTTGESKASVTIRIGADVERLLPDHLVPRLQFGQIGVGVDLSAYYLISADLSYKVGVEVIDPQAISHLEAVFEPVPIISDKLKREAAEAIVSHVESGLPTYFWTPVMRGYGLSGKLYVDIGKRLRIAGRYHSEKPEACSSNLLSGFRMAHMFGLLFSPLVSNPKFNPYNEKALSMGRHHGTVTPLFRPNQQY